MGRLRYVLAGLLLIPLLDVLFLAYVASTLLGWQWTILLVVLTALLGMLFVRAEGRHTLRKIQRALAEGRAPTNEIIDGGMLIAAGAFLLTPGLVTDAIGFILVLPITRIPLRMAIKKFFIVPYIDKQTGGFATGKVYTFGFPDDDDTSRTPGGWTPGGSGDEGSGGIFGGFRSGSDGSSDDTVDLGPESYEVEFEDEDDETGTGERA